MSGCYQKNNNKKLDNDRADKKVIGHLSSPLKNQTDILQTQLVYDLCQTWMYTPAIHLQLILPKSHETANFFKVHEISLNTNFPRKGCYDITPVINAQKAKTCWYHRPFVSFPDTRFKAFIKKGMNRNNKNLRNITKMYNARYQRHMAYCIHHRPTIS